MSHEAEFDKLKSLPIDERIQFIRWLPKTGKSHTLLSANERTIKLWRLSDAPSKTFYNLNFPSETGSRRKMIIRSLSDVKVPKCRLDIDNMVGHISAPRVYDRAHDFSITGLSPSVDQETFLSSDPLRVNLWHYDVTNEVYSIIDNSVADCTPMSHLINCIATSKCSPPLFAYGSNRGSIRLHDLRQHVEVEKPILVFDSLDSDVTDILRVYTSGISDIHFSHLDDRLIFTRDYLVVKVWDTAMPTTPIEVYPVQSELFDKLNPRLHLQRFTEDFRLSISSHNRHIVTGSYKNLVHVFDRNTSSSSQSSSQSTDYRLAMSDEFFISDQIARCMTEPSLSSPADIGGILTWPRPVECELGNNSSATDNGEAGDVYPQTGLLSASPDSSSMMAWDPLASFDTARCWLHVDYCPNSMMFAAAHADAIHLIQPTDMKLEPSAS